MTDVQIDVYSINFFQPGNHHILITYFQKSEILTDIPTLSRYLLVELNTSKILFSNGINFIQAFVAR